MKKENPALQLLLVIIVILFIHLFSGCVKGENECRTCTAKNTAGEVQSEQQVCNSEAENNFRSEHSQFNVECK